LLQYKLSVALATTADSAEFLDESQRWLDASSKFLIQAPAECIFYLNRRGKDVPDLTMWTQPGISSSYDFTSPEACHAFFFFPLGLLRDLLYHYITPQCCSKVIWADCWSSGVGVCSSPEQSQLTLPTVNVDWNLCSTDLCSVLQVLWKRVVTKGAFHCETHLKRSWRYAVMPSRELDFSKNTIDEKQFVNIKKKKLGRYIRAENGFWMNTKTNKEYIE